jgi:chromosome segregation ATPase
VYLDVFIVFSGYVLRNVKMGDKGFVSVRPPNRGERRLEKVFEIFFKTFLLFLFSNPMKFAFGLLLVEFVSLFFYFSVNYTVPAPGLVTFLFYLYLMTVFFRFLQWGFSKERDANLVLLKNNTEISGLKKANHSLTLRLEEKKRKSQKTDESSQSVQSLQIEEIGLLKLKLANLLAAFTNVRNHSRSRKNLLLIRSASRKRLIHRLCDQLRQERMRDAIVTEDLKDFRAEIAVIDETSNVDSAVQIENKNLQHELLNQRKVVTSLTNKIGRLQAVRNKRRQQIREKTALIAAQQTQIQDFANERQILDLKAQELSSLNETMKSNLDAATAEITELKERDERLVSAIQGVRNYYMDEVLSLKTKVEETRLKLNRYDDLEKEKSGLLDQVKDLYASLASLEKEKQKLEATIGINNRAHVANVAELRREWEKKFNSSTQALQDQLQVALQEVTQLKNERIKLLGRLTTFDEISQQLVTTETDLRALNERFATFESDRKLLLPDLESLQKLKSKFERLRESAKTAYSLNRQNALRISQAEEELRLQRERTSKIVEKIQACFGESGTMTKLFEEMYAIRSVAIDCHKTIRAVKLTWTTKKNWSSDEDKLFEEMAALEFKPEDHACVYGEMQEEILEVLEVIAV